MSRDKAKEQVKKFGKILQQHRFNFSHIYIFGSFAKNRDTEESDIDVAVVTKRRPRDFFEKEGELWRLAPKVDNRIEPVLLTEADIRKDSSSIIGNEVHRHGLKVM